MINRLRIVLDANVLISAYLFGGVPQRVFDRVMAEDVELILSTRLLTEVCNVLTRKFVVPEEQVQAFAALLRSAAQFVEPTRLPTICRDVNDDHVLACAREAQAAFIVTGDADLLALGTWEGIAIVRPAEFAGVIPG